MIRQWVLIWAQTAALAQSTGAESDWLAGMAEHVRIPTVDDAPPDFTCSWQRHVGALDTPQSVGTCGDIRVVIADRDDEVGRLIEWLAVPEVSRLELVVASHDGKIGALAIEEATAAESTSLRLRLRSTNFVLRKGRSRIEGDLDALPAKLLEIWGDAGPERHLTIELSRHVTVGRLVDTVASDSTLLHSAVTLVASEPGQSSEDVEDAIRLIARRGTAFPLYGRERVPYRDVRPGFHMEISKLAGPRSLEQVIARAERHLTSFRACLPATLETRGGVVVWFDVARNGEVTHASGLPGSHGRELAECFERAIHRTSFRRVWRSDVSSFRADWTWAPSGSTQFGGGDPLRTRRYASPPLLGK